ncbi:hypothetical protein B0A48_07560 [Cryoendolithus antarcticus]|uniref:Gfd2/YDR514C-like C-terminal domain-containing protein n=1 Tax=Cryoendolithus antarcticus TaxID=1507870 RepID=A0A1V8T6S6_9PEZI|nr:hypothetical protein B0A48_07560 [Cryoendolithus antarcticus]
MSQALKAKAIAKRIANKKPQGRTSSRSGGPIRNTVVSKYAAAKPIIGPRVPTSRIPPYLPPKDVAVVADESVVTFGRLASIAKYFAGDKFLARSRLPFSRFSATREKASPLHGVVRPANWRHPRSARAPRRRPRGTPRSSLRWRLSQEQGLSAQSSIFRLRQILGLPEPGSDVQEAILAPQDAVLVAFDTEFYRTGLIDRVTQLGVTTLDMRDIVDVVPGLRGQQWTTKMRTTQFVTQLANYKGIAATKGLTDCLFTSDIRITSPGCIKEDFLYLLKGVLNGEQRGSSGPRHIVFVGHSIDIDFAVLRKDPHIQLDLLDPTQTGLSIATAFDTLDLAHLAAEHDAVIPSRKLGRLVARLG